jgi:hypothetical protein
MAEQKVSDTPLSDTAADDGFRFLYSQSKYLERDRAALYLKLKECVGERDKYFEENLWLRTERMRLMDALRFYAAAGSMALSRDNGHTAREILESMVVVCTSEIIAE